jgi:hypothetical protein
MTDTVEAQIADPVSTHLGDEVSSDCVSDASNPTEEIEAQDEINLDSEAIEMFCLVSRVSFLEKCEVPEVKSLRKEIINNDYRILSELKKHYPDDYLALATNFGWYPQDEHEALKIVRNIIQTLEESSPKIASKLTPLVFILEAKEGDDIPPIEHASQSLSWLSFNHPEYTIITAWLQRFLHINYVPEIYDLPGDLPEKVVNEAFPEIPDSEFLEQFENLAVDEDKTLTE